MAELEDGINIETGFIFDFHEGVHVPGVEHDGFLADGVGSVA